MIAFIRKCTARTALFSVALAFSLAACGPLHAPELQGIEGWINSRPLTLEELRGRVVLIDFWTYTCVNCVRTFPYLRDWHEKYADHGLVIIGVHTPEFEFEKLKQNVQEAAEVHGLEYPIAQDNGYFTWKAFFNNAWPAKYLIDQEGNIRYTHRGEGAYAETEQVIRELLAESGADVSLIPPNVSSDPEYDRDAYSADPAQRITRELFAGYDRNYALPSAAFSAPMGQTPSYIMQEEYYRLQDADILYQDLGDPLNHFIYLQGLWRNNAESITHARDSGDFEDYIVIKFYATSVNAVLSPDDGRKLEGTRAKTLSDSPVSPNVGSVVRISLDDQPLTRGQAGQDVRFDGTGNSLVEVNESRMYRLVELEEFGTYELKLSPTSAGLSLFAFTFGAYEAGP